MGLDFFLASLLVSLYILAVACWIAMMFAFMDLVVGCILRHLGLGGIRDED